MFWLIVLLGIAIFLIWKRKNGRRRKRSYAKWENTRKGYIKKHYNLNGEEFLIQGTKNYFTIRKNNDLVFTVVNGQVVSVEEKNRKCTYGVE